MQFWKWALLSLLLQQTTVATAVPLSTIGSFCGTFPSQCQKGSQALLAARGTGTDAYYVVEIDPATGSIPVSVSVTIPANGATGAAVPAQADYQGLNNGGTLIGAVGDSSGRQIVVVGGYPVASTIVASNAYASTNVTTLAYVQLIASTANVVNNLCISNSSGSIIKVGTGAPASETARIYLPAGGAGCYTNLNIPAATRISLEALDATASTGYFLLTGY
jgi:hypothetical protein